MDFLSYLTRFNPFNSCDFVILNSIALFEKARPVLEQYDRILLFLDQDEAGQNCSQKALSISSKYTDESTFYTGYKDLNEWLMATYK